MKTFRKNWLSWFQLKGPRAEPIDQRHQRLDQASKSNIRTHSHGRPLHKLINANYSAHISEQESWQSWLGQARVDRNPLSKNTSPASQPRFILECGGVAAAEEAKSVTINFGTQ